jgi:hypothetical protein
MSTGAFASAHATCESRIYPQGLRQAPRICFANNNNSIPTIPQEEVPHG